MKLDYEMAKARIRNEIRNIYKDSHDIFSAAPVNEDDLFTWEATMTGPPDTPYEGGKFKLLVKIPENYPFQAPRFYFITKIYHVNIR